MGFWKLKICNAKKQKRKKRNSRRFITAISGRYKNASRAGNSKYLEMF